MVPLRTTWMPPALVATIPPTVAAAPGGEVDADLVAGGPHRGLRRLQRHARAHEQLAGLAVDRARRSASRAASTAPPAAARPARRAGAPRRRRGRCSRPGGRRAAPVPPRRPARPRPPRRPSSGAPRPGAPVPAAGPVDLVGGARRSASVSTWSAPTAAVTPTRARRSAPLRRGRRRHRTRLPRRRRPASSGGPGALDLTERQKRARGTRMILDRFRMDDKVAVVTGAGRGIGAATALALAEAGADVLLAARTESQLDEVAAEVEQAGPAGRHVVAADLSDLDAAGGPGGRRPGSVRAARRGGQQRGRRRCPARSSTRRPARWSAPST